MALQSIGVIGSIGPNAAMRKNCWITPAQSANRQSAQRWAYPSTVLRNSFLSLPGRGPCLNRATRFCPSDVAVVVP
jgi:hypothetical protein